LTDTAYHPLDKDSPFERPPHPTKAQARAARRAERNAKDNRQNAKPLVAKNEAQQDYLDVLREGESVIAIGPAGTGKTYLAARIAAQRLIKGEIDKIIVSRVTVSKREHGIGFLPGNIDAKMKPWLTPVIEGIRAEVSGQTLDKWKAEGRFEIVPFEYMRGRTFDSSVIILDEAQNATFEDLTLFLTRTGEDSQVIVCGDPGQVDIPNSGLEEITDLADRHAIMDIIEFSEDDVVRSALAKAWVKAIAERRRRLEHQAANASNVDTRPDFLHRVR
jgi:phosphate starvation-inducible PhoH-like protein